MLSIKDGLNTQTTKATQDSASQQINTTYIKGLSVNGKTITYTKGNGTTGTITTQDTDVDTKNTTGSTNTSSKIYLVGATSQAANPQTYSHDTVYVGTDGCLYSNNTKVSVEGHAHTSVSGNAGTATKLATARKISTNGDFVGSATFDGSSDVTMSMNMYNCIAKRSNTNYYPYHRIAKLENMNAAHTDRAITLYITEDYIGGSFGIVRLVLRTNSTGSVSTVEAKWLARYGFDENSIQIGLYNVYGATYADAFLKGKGTYSAYTVRNLGSGNRGTISRTWTLIDSIEVSNTTNTNKLTSKEVYVNITSAATELHGKAYSQIVDAVDAGIVDRVGNNLAIKLNSGTTEGTNLFTFNGSSGKTVNITPASIGAYSKTEIDSMLGNVKEILDIINGVSL